MYTIGKLAKKFNLSRSTLLYYDSIGLLSFSGRTAANYRIYSSEDCQRLEQICIYRQAGLPLHIIKKLLTGASNETKALLEERVYEISKEIDKLREQQKSLIKLLLNSQEVSEVDWKTWGELFQVAGINEYDKWKWHREFEMICPDKHQLLLESIGLSPERIVEIRSWAQSDCWE
jgi:DNA-binding transcriptional MerR regulator